MWRLAVLVVTGCGRIAFDAHLTAFDADPGDGRVADVRPDAPPGSVTVTLGEAAGTTIGGVTHDTRISSVATNFNYGTALTMYVDPTWVSLIRFDLVAIPSTSTVLAARVHLVQSPSNSGTVRIYPVLESWVEGTTQNMVGAASWMNRTLMPSPIPWTNPGAGPPTSRSTSLIGTIDVTPAVVEYDIDLDVSIVQGWLVPTANNGMALTADTLLSFYAHEALDQAQRPVMTVVYTP